MVQRRSRIDGSPTARTAAGDASGLLSRRSGAHSATAPKNLAQRDGTRARVRSRGSNPNARRSTGFSSVDAVTPPLSRLWSIRLAASMTACSPPPRCGLAMLECVARSARRPTLTASARGASGLPCRKGPKCAARPAPLLTARKQHPHTGNQCPQLGEQSSMRQYVSHLDCRAAPLFTQHCIEADCFELRKPAMPVESGDNLVV